MWGASNASNDGSNGRTVSNPPRETSSKVEIEATARDGSSRIEKTRYKKTLIIPEMF